ncbi:MAG: RidA family protein [Rhodospirillaceae bacterium]|nr:RidA family protein [Rhodospirillaceae bacterium]MBT5944202.1 RidA family protein [Rhodospirillaceae bacterium]MBT6403615.1 RidA family protein [Rhodospirillaceae bacterium]MBT6536560.1 RidA family protein [Rhodospirillaceae bacterium]MBT7361948.1 RidA family protein [Rhodospirillaceae bacterium]
MIEILQPEGWARPRGYSNGMAASGRLVFVGGQIGWNPETGVFETDDFAPQVGQALENVRAVLAEAGGLPEHITRLTWFVTDKKAYLENPKGVGGFYRSVMGSHFPAMSVVEVSALVEDRARVEIEATAVLP